MEGRRAAHDLQYFDIALRTTAPPDPSLTLGMTYFSIMSCLFCRNHHELTDNGEVVFETDHFSVMLHSDWAVRGHAMIIAKRHVENVCDLTPHEAAHFIALQQKVEAALLEVTGTERAILLKLGIQVAHLHLHIYPMRATDHRATVQAAFDMNTSVPRDDNFVRAVRERLATAS